MAMTPDLLTLAMQKVGFRVLGLCIGGTCMPGSGLERQNPVVVLS